MKILITGANGYLGSKVVKKLLDYGNDVVASDFCNNNIDTRATFVKANIFENNQNWFTFFGKPDICLHMAWRDGFVHNSNKHMGDLSFHYNFLSNLIENGLKRVACMGTMHEVGYWEGAITENTPCSPLSQYGISKNALRTSLELLCRQKDCKFQWIRGYYIYGDDTFGNSIFCKIRKAVSEGKSLFPFTSGQNKYDFIHIDDFAQQLAMTVSQDKVLGVINCCSGKPVSLAEQVEWYIKSNHLPIKLDYGKYPDRPYDSPCVFGDSKKIEEISANFEKKHGRILVTGKNGQLGYDCIKELKRQGYTNVLGIDREELDITKRDDAMDFLLSYKPDIVIHNAAWTAVDKAETAEKEVFDVNANGTKYIAEACKEIDAKLFYISTDYVFDGKGDKPFEVTDPRNGLSVYGKSKAKGEDYVRDILDKYFIIRISGAFGVNGNNFVKTMIGLYEKGRKEFSVVYDQIGSVTYTVDLAKLIVTMMCTQKYGVYHATNEGYVSWYEFSKKIFELMKFDVTINGVSTDEYLKMVPNQATRPLNSRLSKKTLTSNGFSLLPDWEDALKRYLEELKK